MQIPDIIPRLRYKQFIKVLSSSSFTRRRYIVFDIKCVVTGGADKSLARPGRKKATATENFEFHISLCSYHQQMHFFITHLKC